MEGKALIPPGSTPEYELNRSRFLEYLYRLDGRDDPGHTNHALYTGLMEEYRYLIGQQVVDDIVTRWVELGPELEEHLEAIKASLEPSCSPST
jgi:hypothetical protein